MTTRLRFSFTVIMLLALSAILSLQKVYSQQVTFIIGSAYNITTPTVTIPVKAVYFKKLTAWQGSINWDNTKLNYSSINNVVTTLNGMQFAYTVTSGTGTLSFVWIDSALKAETILDSTVLFTLTFSVVNRASGSISVGFTNSPTSLQLSDSAYNAVNNVSYINGTVSLAYTTIIPQFIISTINNVSTANVSIPITVKYFNQIMAFQGSINWDSTVLQYSSISNINSIIYGLQTNVTYNVTTGQLNYLWIDSGLNARTVPDSTVLFNLNFKVLNSSVGITSIYFNNSPLNLLVSDANGNPDSVLYLSGKVAFVGSQLPPDFTLKTIDTASTVILPIPVIVKYFNQIKAFQGTIIWDSSKYIFISISTNLSVLKGLAFNNYSGSLSYLWVDSLLVPETISDNSVLFTLFLQRKCGATGSDDVKFSNQKTTLTVINSTDQVIQNVTYNNGKILIPSFVTPAALISTPSNSFCTGGLNMNFIAVGYNTGSSPIYHWYRNGVPINGANTSTLNTNQINISDIISCTIKGNAACSDTTTAISNNLIILPSISVKDSIILYGCASVTYNGKVYNTSTSFFDTLRNTNNCDSVYRKVNINIKPLTATTLNVSLIGCNKVLYKGKTYTTSAVEKDTIRSVQGCDSIYNVATITINKITPVTNSTSVSGCNSVTYKGVNYTATSIERDTVRSYQGCDSIYNIGNITVNKITAVTNSTSFSGCNSIVYKGVTYISSAIERDTVRSYQGCDSIYNIATIIVNKITPVTYPSNVSGCNSVVYKGNTFTASAIERDTVKSYQGCDSIYNIGTITINKIIAVTNPASVRGCNSVVYKGKTYTTSAVEKDTIRSVQGCDSIYNVATITINKITPVTNSTSVSGCNSVTYKGVYYTATSIERDTVRSYQGCDSIYNIGNITVNKITAVTNTTSFSGCNSIVYKGVTYISSAIERDTVRSYQGCDSIYNIATIIVNKITPTTNPTSISGCNSVVYKGVTYTASAIERDTVKSYQGCDSIYNITNIFINNINVSGNIYHPSKGYTIPNVFVILSDTSTKATGNTGYYNIGCLPNGENETIKLYKNNDINKTNGVTALDIALVQAHILQKNLLKSPFKIIAADVNGDGKVTALDIVYTKRLILGIDTTFTNTVTSQKRLWAFVDSSYKFPDTTNPFPIKDSISYTGLNASQINQTFIGCKLGDVNWDWNPAVARPILNNLNAIELSYPSVRPGRASDGYIRIPVKVKNFKDMLGIQFTISFNSNILQWQGMGNNPLGIETGTNHAADGSVSFLWVDPKNEIKTLEDGSVLMELLFVPNYQLSTINYQLSLDGSITEIAAYDKDYNLHDIIMNPSLINTSDIVKETFTVAPNPTTEGVIHVQLNLKNNKTIVFRLIDNSGRLLLTQQIEGIKGNNNIILKEQSQIPAGTYFLQTIGMEGEVVKKIIIK